MPRCSSVPFLPTEKKPFTHRTAEGGQSVNNPHRTAREIRGKLREIDRRLANVEEHYVSSNPRLDAEIERLR